MAHDPAIDPVQSMPPHPLTLDGSAVLHQMFRVRWPEWNALTENRQREIAREAAEVLNAFEEPAPGGSALFSQLGHKGDLLLVHFRDSFEEINEAELALCSLELHAYLEQTTSYVSVVELGLYDSTVKLYEELLAEGIAPSDPTWRRTSAIAHGRAGGGDGAALATRDSAEQVPLLLSDGQEARRGSQLVHG